MNVGLEAAIRVMLKEKEDVHFVSSNKSLMCKYESLS